MSWWLRSAVNRTVEVGGKNNSLTRVVRNYADSIVAGGARIFQDRIASRNLRSFSQTVKRLEEVSVSCRGQERIQLLRRWLVALKEIERVDENYNDSEQQHPYDDESKDSPKKPTLVLYYDPDFGGEPMNFCDVFLHSRALEGIALSMILEAPQVEEVSLLLEIFGLCITGGKEVHKAILSSIQDLAKVSSSYQDEVLVRREELLQYAQDAIAGLKINAQLLRIDTEASSLEKKLDEFEAHQQALSEDIENSSGKPKFITTEALKDALEQIQVSSKLEGLILKKKSIRSGDSPEIYAHKVAKLKVLSESLASSTAKAESRVWDHRSQKEEALNFRLARANEVSQIEKDLGAKIGTLENKRDELEAELKKVNTSLTGALVRFKNLREEREQFDVASDQVVVHLKMKEDELSKSIETYRAEADAVNRWINFLEDTWVLQTSYTDQNAKQVNDELEKYGDYLVNFSIYLLSAYKTELGPSIACIRTLVKNLNSTGGSEKIQNVEDGKSSEIIPRKSLEEEYLASETKLITTFSVVDSMKEHFTTQHGDVYRKDGEKVKELFDVIDRIKNEFETIKRPILKIETPIRIEETPSKKKPPKYSSFTPKQTPETLDYEQNELLASLMIKGGDKALNPEDALSKLKIEFGRVSSTGHSMEDIGDWEFDVLEPDLKSNDTQAKP